MNLTEIERLKNAIELLKRHRTVLSQAEFAEKIKIKPSQISEMLKGKRPISERTIRLVGEVFPEINTSWLLTGDGEMLKTNNSVAGSGSTVPMPEQMTIDRLLSIIESQQRTIENLTSK